MADKVFLALENFSKHMTNEGWQLQEGLREAGGFELWGKGYPGHRGLKDVKTILNLTNPHTVIIQDKREWDSKKPGCFDKDAAFLNHIALRGRDDIFTVTIHKDAHSEPKYHFDFHQQIGCDAWIVYYKPSIVATLAPWIPEDRMVRTYHSVNLSELPVLSPEMKIRGCLLHGVLLDSVYPLRHRLARELDQLPDTDLIPHPGYNDEGWQTPSFLLRLGHYKVSICTVSKYQYALRKLIESTACGCVVLTDLDVETLPEIQGNLIPISKNNSTAEIGGMVAECIANYDFDKQLYWAQKAQSYYNHLSVGERLAQNIERMRNDR